MRFSEFVDDYQFTDIKSVSIFVKDGTHGTHQDVEIGIPLLSAKDISDGRINIDDNSRNISCDDYKKIYRKVTPTKNDILITIVGTVGRTAIIPEEFPIFAFQRSVGWIRPIDSICPEYFDFVLQSKSVQQRIQKEVNASAQGGIYLEKLSSITIEIPSLKEQTKVSSFLKLLNERINTQNKIIEKYESLIKQLNDDLFSHDSNSKIGEHIQESSKRNKDGLIANVLSVSNKNGFVKQSEQFEDKELASEDKTNYKIVQKGDFAFNPARINVGSIALLKNQEIGIVSPMYICFKAKNIPNEVLESFFSSSSFKKEMNKRLEGSVRMCLTIDGMKNIPFHKPNEKEIDILDHLSKLKEFVSLNKRILDLYNSQKSYLLSNLFI